MDRLKKLRKIEVGQELNIQGYVTTDYQAGSIPTIRCSNCKQHLSLYGNEIKNGEVIGSVTCPNCKTVNEKLELDPSYNKSKNNAYLAK